MGWEMLPPKYDEDRGDWPTGTRCSSDDLYSKSEVKKSVKSYVSKEKYDQLRARNAEIEAEVAALESELAIAKAGIESMTGRIK